MYRQVGDSQNDGYLLGVLNNKGYSILGSILGSPYLGKLPSLAQHAEVPAGLYPFAKTAPLRRAGLEFRL